MQTSWGGIFDYEAKQEQLAEVIRELEEPTVWDKPERAQELGRERVTLEKIVHIIDELDTSLADASELLEMAAEEDDEETVQSVTAELDGKEKALEQLEFKDRKSVV